MTFRWYMYLSPLFKSVKTNSVFFFGMKFFRNIFRDREFGGRDVKVVFTLISIARSIVLCELQFIDPILQVELELSFMEAVQGCTKTINFRTSVICDTCST